MARRRRRSAGTYAFASTRAGTIVTGVAPDTFHWTALDGPIAGAGVLAIEPDAAHWGDDGPYPAPAASRGRQDPVQPSRPSPPKV